MLKNEIFKKQAKNKILVFKKSGITQKKLTS